MHNSHNDIVIIKYKALTSSLSKVIRRVLFPWYGEREYVEFVVISAIG